MKIIKAMIPMLLFSASILVVIVKAEANKTSEIPLIITQEIMSDSTKKYQDEIKEHELGNEIKEDPINEKVLEVSDKREETLDDKGIESMVTDISETKTEVVTKSESEKKEAIVAKSESKPEEIVKIENPPKEEVTKDEIPPEGKKLQLTIPSAGIDTSYAIGNNSQASVNANDIVYAADIYEIYGTVRFYGHNTHTFSKLCKTAVGDIIMITDDDGNLKTYSVVFSGKGNINDSNTNIVSESNGTELLYNGYIEFVTCHGLPGGAGRWVVLAK